MLCLDTTPSSAQAIEYILNSMPPSTLVFRLRTALDPALGHTPEEFSAFLDALKGLGLERAIKQAEAIVKHDEANPGKGGERHCVRCHKPYRESGNSFEACTITYSAVLFGTPSRNTSRHTADARQAMKTKGDVPARTCREEWCGRQIFGAESAAVPSFFTPAVASTTISGPTATSANTFLTLSSSTKAPNATIPASVPAPVTPNLTLLTNGTAIHTAPLKDVKVNTVNGVPPQATAKLGNAGQYSTFNFRFTVLRSPFESGLRPRQRMSDVVPV